MSCHAHTADSRSTSSSHRRRCRLKVAARAVSIFSHFTRELWLGKQRRGICYRIHRSRKPQPRKKTTALESERIVAFTLVMISCEWYYCPYQSPLLEQKRIEVSLLGIWLAGGASWSLSFWCSARRLRERDWWREMTASGIRSFTDSLTSLFTSQSPPDDRDDMAYGESNGEKRSSSLCSEGKASPIYWHIGALSPFRLTEYNFPLTFAYLVDQIIWEKADGQSVLFG